MSSPPSRWAAEETHPKIIRNVAAARPAAGAVTPGDFFHDTDTDVVQQSNGREWAAVSAGETFYDIREYGLLTTAATTAAAIDAALAAAGAHSGSSAAVVLLPPGAITTTGDHEIPAGCRVRGFGAGATKVTHTGNNACFWSAPHVYDKTSAVSGVWIVGNSGAAACGIRHGDQWGFELNDVLIDGYTGNYGWLFYNDAGWTEGTICNNVRIRDCASGIGFMRSADSDWNSFGYTRLYGLGINVPANGVGIFLGDNGEKAASHYIYHSEIHANFWLDDSASAMAFTGNSEGNFNQMFVTGEKESGAGSTTTWGPTDPSYWEYRGVVRVDSDDSTPRATVTTNFIDLRNAAEVAINIRGASGQTAPLIRVRDSGGNETASLYDWGGWLANYIGVGSADPETASYIYAGAGSPEGAVSAAPGSIYLRNDGGTGTSFYVKESGTGNTGWVAK